MMRAERRKMVLIGMLLLMLTLAAVWSAQAAMDRHQAAQLAADDWQRCEMLAATIASLQGKPANAADEAAHLQQVGQRLKQANDYAALDEGSLAGVTPQSSRRIGNTPYLQKPTALSLQRVTLQQLAAFLLNLTQDSSLTVRDIRLQAPRNDSSGQYWDVQATVTYLIYSPSDKPRRTP